MLGVELALRSFRFRVGGFAASFLAVFLGATLLMGFASMLDTRGNAVDATSKDTLFIVATVVGGWGLIIVAFSVASTLTLFVRQRAREIALLKSIGATPAQVRRLVIGEAALIALVAALAAILPGVLVGRLLLELLQDTGQVAPAVSHSFGPIALSLGLGIAFLGSTIAAFITARRAAKVRAVESLRLASLGPARMSKKRIVAAGLLLLIALDLAIVTATVMNGKGIDAMQTAGQASLLAAVGLALLAPFLARTVAARVAGAFEALGASGYLAAENMRRRSQQMASALMPIIILIATTGTLYMQSIENGASTVGDTTITAAEAKNIETLNYVVVGIFAAFAAIVLVNTLVAATTARRQEFGQLRLAGATPVQVLRMVSLESLVLLVTGVLFGSIAALFTLLPYSVARTDSLVPDVGVGIYVAVVAAAAVLTLAASLGTARRAAGTPAIEAVMP
jgi:predicted lysophospholipase L1 biosynthesis ABC-type transport system permease subunit